MKLKLTPKNEFLINSNARYKVLYGGRGSGKSWIIADCILFKMISSPVRILCTRELQNTIKDSVHRLLCDRIKEHQLDNYFVATDSEIRCVNNSLCIFKGLRSNVNEVKSLEGIDICWVEEANLVSAESWDILTPTIRKENSEIWISFNTGAEDDEVYTRFVKAKREDTITAKINYYDNPFFPVVLRKEMEWDRENNLPRYKNVWLGEPGAYGKFFIEFGEHLKEHPFLIPLSACEGKIIGSLDSGTTHATSYGHWYIDENFVLHRLFTYMGTGLTIRAHAEEIFQRIESFSYTGGYFPDVIVADPSMWTKVKLNDFMVRSPIDEYIECFQLKNTRTKFERANNQKDNGCQIMKMLFRGTNDIKPMRYFDGYNKSFEDGISKVITDENNIEIYAKQDGDDVADESRYGVVKCFSVMGNLRNRQIRSTPKTHLEQLLSGKFANKNKQAEDWYNA